ncbi:DUF2268 domain-containing putative Zn-dependent protease [Flavobacterium ardleyense]|uniref:DUF2268 domain-containing putative Zn-dependent protease n=1 Tax=Flavobacterium ardleyense TaxID=2038737 RepID=A0ABW5Z9P1_9FLAO
MKIEIFLIITFISSFCFSQNKLNIYTNDIDNFWIAFDSITKTNNELKQLNFLQKLYLDKATDGLNDFIVSREHTAERHLDNIKNYPKFWNSIRPKTEEIKNYTLKIEKVFKNYHNIYPDFKEPEIYFTIGVLNSGGTTSPNKILIGSEIACADKNTNASELNDWLEKVFKLNNGVVAMVAHEIGHTQQKDGDSEDDGKSNLLGYCIREGMCDFLAELTYQKISSPYMIYGKEHRKQLWTEFQKEMLTQETKNWLYNGNDAPNGVADLGYFMGYEICKSYYKNSKDKKKAIDEMLKLEYNAKSVTEFLKKSKYNG